MWLEEGRQLSMLGSQVSESFRGEREMLEGVEDQLRSSRRLKRSIRSLGGLAVKCCLDQKRIKTVSSINRASENFCARLRAGDDFCFGLEDFEAGLH